MSLNTVYNEDDEKLDSPEGRRNKIILQSDQNDGGRIISKIKNENVRF